MAIKKRSLVSSRTNRASRTSATKGCVEDMTIEALSHDGRGIAKPNGKVVFVENALPGEKVQVRICESRRRFSAGIVEQYYNTSSLRVEAKCPQFSQCGGCQLQHLDYSQQLQEKWLHVQRLLSRAQLFPDEAVCVDTVAPKPWQYRARVRFLVNKGLLGFRSAASHQFVEIKQCLLLNEALGQLFPLLAEQRALWRDIGAREIEVTQTSTQPLIHVYIRHALSTSLKQKLSAWAEKCQFAVAVSVPNAQPFAINEQAEASSHYSVQDVRINYSMHSFIQVNTEVNVLLVDAVIKAVQLRPMDRVLDLFCGIGNFTLPLARHVLDVVGVEVNRSAVTLARQNAQQNALSNVSFHECDLFAEIMADAWRQNDYDMVLLDPPRAGAQQVVTWLSEKKPRWVFYISCDPSTLARDAKLLIDAGYRYDFLQLFDMFAQTKHVETFSIFTIQ